MKNTIEWHKHCLKNRKASLDRERSELEGMRERLDNSCSEYNLYVFQINTAQEEKKDSFDAKKYAIKRLAK